MGLLRAGCPPSPILTTLLLGTTVIGAGQPLSPGHPACLPPSPPDPGTLQQGAVFWPTWPTVERAVSRSAGRRQATPGRISGTSVHLGLPGTFCTLGDFLSDGTPAPHARHLKLHPGQSLAAETTLWPPPCPWLQEPPTQAPDMVPSPCHCDAPGSPTLVSPPRLPLPPSGSTTPTDTALAQAVLQSPGPLEAKYLHLAPPGPLLV